MAESHDRELLLAAHADHRRAHYERDPELLFRDAAEQWTYVRDGQIEQLSHAELVERFRINFSRCHYHEWDDVQPPSIEISEDARSR